MKSVWYVAREARRIAIAALILALLLGGGYALWIGLSNKDLNHKIAQKGNNNDTADQFLQNQIIQLQNVPPVDLTSIENRLALLENATNLLPLITQNTMQIQLHDAIIMEILMNATTSTTTILQSGTVQWETGVIETTEYFTGAINANQRYQVSSGMYTLKMVEMAAFSFTYLELSPPNDNLTTLSSFPANPPLQSDTFSFFLSRFNPPVEKIGALADIEVALPLTQTNLNRFNLSPSCGSDCFLFGEGRTNPSPGINLNSLSKNAITFQSYIVSEPEFQKFPYIAWMYQSEDSQPFQSSPTTESTFTFTEPISLLLPLL